MQPRAAGTPDPRRAVWPHPPWRNGAPSANLADQAKRLYGDCYAEFLDGVKAFAFYPLAIRKEPPPAGDLRLSVRFYPIAGKIDQAAGIAFGGTRS